MPKTPTNGPTLLKTAPTEGRTTMSIPNELRELADIRDQLNHQYQTSVISADEALSTLAQQFRTDGTGAIWTIAPEGHFFRAPTHGAQPEPAHYTDFVPHGTQPEPEPAFPSPTFQDLDTSPQHTPSFGPGSDPAIGPVLPMGEPSDHATPLRSILDDQPDNPPHKTGIVTKLLDFARNNKLFVGIALIGAVIGILAATGTFSSDTSTEIPGADDDLTNTDTPNATMPLEAPPAIADLPSDNDSLNAIAILQIGSIDDIKTVVADEKFNTAKAFRTQALWRGVSELDGVVEPQKAGKNEDGEIVQTWEIYIGEQPEPTAKAKVTWTIVDDTWQFAKAPNF